MKQPEKSNCILAAKPLCPFAIMSESISIIGDGSDLNDAIMQLDELLHMVKRLHSQCIEKLRNQKPTRLPIIKIETLLTTDEST